MLETTPLPPVTPPGLPEAPCSVNTHVDVAGLRIQITGRGYTGDEAALNFRDTLAAMRVALETPAPALDPEETLGEVATRWMAHVAQQGDVASLERLTKALALVVMGHVVPIAEVPGDPPLHAWRVTAMDGTRAYDVAMQADIAACPCKDYQHRAPDNPRFLCKHGLAVLLTRAAPTA